MGRRKVIALAGAMVFLGGVGFAALRYIAARESRFCKACSRPVHHLSRTVAVSEGRKSFFCCPSCALFEHQQSGKRIEVVELTDHLGGGMLNAADSYVVRDSDVNLCHQHQPSMSADKQPMHSHFDRCAPSILTFRDRGTAETFAGEHGGQVFRFADLARNSLNERTP
jgi:hypothetical protein